MESTQMSITIIPKKKNLFMAEDGTIRKKKVCAYARVSTDLEDQKNSFNAQLEEYAKRISENPEWEFVKLYSDEGISGTSLKRREGFKEMIDDALAGKIDLILTKSISRFARNTVDCIKTYRDLKAANVGIYFDKEHINSLEKDVEFQLTLYASMAQEESKTISENVKWGVRSRMKRGDRKMNVKYTLGYRYDAQGKIVVIEEEAELVKSIFGYYLGGYYISEIAKILRDENRLKKNGKTDWKYIDVYRILTDEKYIGMFVMQKTVVKSFLDHKAYKNNGIEDKVVLNNHHQEIVTKDNFDYIQILLKNQKESPQLCSKRKDASPLSGISYCGCCGLPLTRIIGHPGKAYERSVLTCRNIKKNSINYKNCDYKSETTDYDLSVKALYEVFWKYYEKTAISVGFFMQNLDISIKELIEEKKKIDSKIEELQDELQQLLTRAISTNSKTNEIEFNDINFRLNEEKGKLERITQSIYELRDLTVDANHIKHMLENDDDHNPTNRLIRNVIKMVIRKRDGSLRFIVSKDNLATAEVHPLLQLVPTYSSSVSNEKRTLNYEVVVLKGGKNGAN